MTGEPRSKHGARTRWRRLVTGVPGILGVVASLITIGVVGLGIYQAQTKSESSLSPSAEAKQVISFHQVTIRICAENQGDLERARLQAHSDIQLLAFLFRGTGWGINDLEGVTPPATLAESFTEEISVRDRIRKALLEVQSAREMGNAAAQARALVVIDSAERAAVEAAHALGLRGCAPVLPETARRAARLN